jgi:hypothetical protein
VKQLARVKLSPTLETMSGVKKTCRMNLILGGVNDTGKLCLMVRLGIETESVWIKYPKVNKFYHVMRGDIVA